MQGTHTMSYCSETDYKIMQHLQNFYKIKVLQSLTALKLSQNKVFLSRWHRDTDNWQLTSDAEYYVLFNTFFY